MGVVYKGRHTIIERPIAIKFLNPQVATNEEVILRFQNEARITASIGHRNIVEIIDMGKFRGKFHYIIMEFLEGEDLATILKRRERISYREAVDIAIQVLNGLYVVHLKNIIHRDLKPENIFIAKEPDGHFLVKIVDFGISRLLEKQGEKRSRLTKEGLTLGTPEYMSPEQVSGKRDIDHRTDIYSAGVILYEMLVGSTPFHSDNTSALLLSILNSSPFSPKEVYDEIPDALSQIVLKAISKNPDDRFQTAKEFSEALIPFSSNPHQFQVSPVSEKSKIEAESSVVIEIDKREIQFSPTQLMHASQPEVVAKEEKKKYSEKLWISLLVAFLVLIPSVSFIIYKSFWRNPKNYEKISSRENRNKEMTDLKPSQKKLELWKVNFDFLPDGAKVYIDGILHEERPVMTQDSNSPRLVRIEVKGEKIFEKEIPVRGDTWITLENIAKKENLDKKGFDKEVDVKKGLKKIKKEKKKIDEEYPTF